MSVIKERLEFTSCKPLQKNRSHSDANTDWAVFIHFSLNKSEG